MKINVIMEEVRTKNISADGINENADLYLLDVNVLKNFSNDIPVTDNEDRVIGKVDKCKLEEILSTRPVEMIPKILDCITAGIVAIDTSGTIFYANQEYSNLIGKSLKDILGRNVDEFTAHSAIITVARTGQRIIMDKRFLEAVNKNVSGVVYPIYVM